MLIIRFLGTTPQSSAIDSTLLSICQQLCYNLVKGSSINDVTVLKEGVKDFVSLVAIKGKGGPKIV